MDIKGTFYTFAYGRKTEFIGTGTKYLRIKTFSFMAVHFVQYACVNSTRRIRLADIQQCSAVTQYGIT
jgi:hypothetical protein